MKGLWLHRAPRNAAAPLIVFCNGWGMTEQVAAHLDGTGCNVLCLYDYRSPELPADLRDEVRALMLDTAEKMPATANVNTMTSAAFPASGMDTEKMPATANASTTAPAASPASGTGNADKRNGITEDASLSRAQSATGSGMHTNVTVHSAGSAHRENRTLPQPAPQRILIAWSLGVFMSACVRRQLPPFDVTLACNGTQRPIDAACGIPPASYETTERMLSPATRDAFMANAGMDSSLCRQQVEELREELTTVRQLASSGTVDAPPFDAAIISRKDRIFSARNQRRWWQSRPETRIIPQEGGHCPFANFSAWLELAHV